jgi:hypothetical protein
MIYLEETFNLAPASPETLDRFIEFAQEDLLPAYQRLEARLVAAWYSDSERLCQVMQVLEFDNLGALGAFRAKAARDGSWTGCEARLEELAPERRSRLLELLGPVPAEALHEAAAESRNSSIGAYSLALLEVAPGKMSQFTAALEGAARSLPIGASWRTVVGKANEVTDVWKGALRQSGYQPADEGSRQFFRLLRELAPQERLVHVYPLPYSPLL